MPTFHRGGEARANFSPYKQVLNLASQTTASRCYSPCLVIFLFVLFPGVLNEPDLCYTWGSHFHTFDGRYFFFPGRCTYKLVHDCQDDMFSVHVHSDTSCKTNTNCRRAVNLYLGGMDIKVIHSFSLPIFTFSYIVALLTTTSRML